MRRRNFIKVVAAGSGTLLIPSVLSGCDAQRLTALDAWRGPDDAEKDIRIRVLSYALLAPNPHNKQPWVIDLQGPEHFDLYVDPDRLLPETDPPYRQIHISQGTFLESLSLAAGQFGYRADIEYFPHGMYANTALEHKPVASIQLTRSDSLKRDPLFDFLQKRQSNRRVFSDHPLSGEQLDGIRAAATSSTDFALTVTTDRLQRKRLTEFATKAMAIEVVNKRRIEESVDMFRFNDEELQRHRDGFGAPQMGADGLKKYLIEHLFISRQSFLGEGSSFGEQSVDGVFDQAGSAAAFGWLVSNNNTRLDQILAGRIYDRINLTATALGVAMHPMSQVLQEYADMASLQREFKRYLNVTEDQTVQMFFRLGIAEPIRHTARRRVQDLIAPGRSG